MVNFLKRNIVFVFGAMAILTVPIGLNFLIPIENILFEIYGDEKTWFSFWSSYSGAVISGLITLVVLYKTLRQNQENYKEQQKNSLELSNKQMNFQIKLMDYQNKKLWLSELKNRLTLDLGALDFSNIEKLVNRISIVSSNKDLLDDISTLEKEIKGIQTNLIILYHDNFDSKERKAYKKATDNLVKNLNNVLAALTEHLLKHEESFIEIQARINNVKNVSNMDLTPLTILREKGYKDFSEKRKEIFTKIKSSKKQIEFINLNLRYSLVELVKYEEKQINTEIIL